MTVLHTKRKRQRPKEGDVFAVPLNDGSYTVGQVLGYEPDALNSVGCAFYDMRSSGEPRLPAALPREKAISILLTTPDPLKRGYWPIVGEQAIATPVSARPYEKYRAKRWVGAKIVGSANVRELLEAFYGLAPWDDYADPEYLDGLLLDRALRPKNAVMTKRQP